MISLLTIEDCLEVAAGLHKNSNVTIQDSDKTIMYSIARQVFKGSALTDKQLALMQDKLLKYENQFDCDLKFVITQLRKPLRQIDRSKFIKIIDNDIKVRFPFKKSLIILINKISNCNGYFHEKGSHSHWFTLNDCNIDAVLTEFIDKNFEIDKELILRYNSIQKIKNNKLDYLPYFTGTEFVNCPKEMVANLKNEIDDLSNNNFIKIADRRDRHAYYVDVPEATSLTQQIAFRKEKLFHNMPTKNNLTAILNSLYELDRFPLIVTLDDNNSLDQLYQFQTFFRDLIPTNLQSVLFRQEGSTDFNNYIKEKKLNNWVDKNTKIVYINTMKVPKILINHESWHPLASFGFSSTVSREVNTYISHYTDLMIYHEEDISPFRKHSRLYAS